MKKIMFICLLFLFFNINLNGKTCPYKIYNYQNKTVVIKFDCNDVTPFYVSIINIKGEKVDDFLYNPVHGENTFLINFLDLTEPEFIIEIIYSSEKPEFIFTKK